VERRKIYKILVIYICGSTLLSIIQSYQLGRRNSFRLSENGTRSGLWPEKRKNILWEIPHLLDG
jgi:hypothetical protein